MALSLCELTEAHVGVRCVGCEDHPVAGDVIAVAALLPLWRALRQPRCAAWQRSPHSAAGPAVAITHGATTQHRSSGKPGDMQIFHASSHKLSICVADHVSLRAMWSYTAVQDHSKVKPIL